jgi:hypothetical protein
LPLRSRDFERVLGELASHGVSARGSIGDEDPLPAAMDALNEFDADEVVLIVGDGNNERWRERRLVNRIAETGLPVTLLTVPHPVR